jgi:hypothetical protein
MPQTLLITASVRIPLGYATVAGAGAGMVRAVRVVAVPASCSDSRRRAARCAASNESRSGRNAWSGADEAGSGYEARSAVGRQPTRRGGVGNAIAIRVAIKAMSASGQIRWWLAQSHRSQAQTDRANRDRDNQNETNAHNPPRKQNEFCN